MSRFVWIVAAPFRCLLFLLVLLPVGALGATYTFSGGSLPPCNTWNGAWSVNGNTYTCSASASLPAGDRISPGTGIIVIAEAGWTLGGNNIIGSASTPVSLRTGYGAITASAGLTLYGGMVTTSGDMTISGGTIYGNLSSASGTIRLTNTVLNGSLDTGDTAILNGGSVSGNVTAKNGVSTTNGTTIGGNVSSTNGAISLSGGSVTGSVISNCCQVSTNNTNVSGGVASDRSTVRITGGTISGNIYSSGGSGIIIVNATVSNGSINATNVPISITGSSIGSPISIVNVENNNNITITSSTVYGTVHANPNWSSLVVSNDSVVTIECIPMPNPPGPCGGSGPVTPIHHFEIDLPPAGLTCADTTIVVRACASNVAPCLDSLSSAQVTTTLTTSAGSFVNSGGATRTFTGSDGYLLSRTTPAVVSIGMSAPAGATLQCFRQEGVTRTPLASCQFEVKSTIFRFTVPNFSAGDGAASVAIEAVREDDNSRKCVSFVPSGGVKMWSEYVNPASGDRALTLSHGGQNLTLPRSEPAAGNVPLVFNASGQASFGLNYHDAGRVRLRAKWNATEGSSAFVVKPYFAVSGLACGDGTPNPAATGPSGGKFCAAGAPFSATVKAVASDRATPTPNFGRETPAESVMLRAAQVSPSTLPSPPGQLLGSLTKNGTDPSIASGSGFSWSEVGIISLTPEIADGDYLGAGNVTADPVPYVGRFHPHYFTTAIAPPMDCDAVPTTGCPVSRGTPNRGMAYARQPLAVTVTARNGNGEITRNYAGGTGYARAGQLAAFSAAGAATAPAAEGAGSLAGSAFTASSFLAGEAKLSSVSYAFTTPPGKPTDIYLRASEAGGDGISSLRLPASASEEAGVRIAQGRIHLANVFGNGKAPLTMPIEAQYWSGKSWVLNVADTTPLTQGALASSGPSPLNILSFSFSGGRGSIRLSPAAGTWDIGLNLGASGAAFASCGGSLSGGVAANVPWLRSRSGSCADADPTARVTFGIYQPESRKTIHVRELY